MLPNPEIAFEILGSIKRAGAREKILKRQIILSNTGVDDRQLLLCPYAALSQ